MRAGEPSRTAFGAAIHRAVHQDLEGGRVFADPLAWRILGVDREPVLADARAKARRSLRLFIAVRHRFAEDSLAEGVRRGTDQAVILGAGLDTFGYRNPHPALLVFEVDHPATGAWKRDRLADAGIAVPASVRSVGVDFEHQDLLAELAGSGFDPTRPAFFLWLGVVPYLTREAVLTTLRGIATLPGAEVVFDYPTDVADLDPPSRALREGLADRVAALGEPIRTTFRSAELHRLLHQIGYAEIEDLGRPENLRRYFGIDPVGVPAAGGGHVVRARIR